MKRTCVIAVLTAACVAGCAPLGPDYQRPAFELPSGYPEATIEPAAAEVPANWWTLYGDSQLNELVEGALVRNSDIRFAVARIEEADATLREANATLLPEIDAAVNPNRTRFSNSIALPAPATIPPVRNDIRIAATTAFELDFWGRLRRGQESVRAQALGTRYARDVVALTLAGSTTQTYFALRALDAQILLTRQTLAAREESLDYVSRRARGGIASDLDLAQAQSARADAATQLQDLLRQREIVAHLLATLTGRLDLTLPAGDLLALPMPPLPPPGMPSILIERRPDIRAAEQALVAANAQIGVAKAALLPTVMLTGTDGWESAALSSLLRSGSSIWSLGFGLTLPIFDWGRYQARADGAIARAHQSVASYQKSIETGFREVADALSSVQHATLAETEYQARVDAVRRALRLARMRYEAGYSAYLEVLDAQRSANDAELAWVKNRQLRLAASVDLMKALGGGWVADSTLPSAQLKLR